MNKYRGKYRVVCEFSIDTLEPIKESTYIFCANGGEIYRYNDNTLAYYRNSILVKSLLEKLDNANVNYINKAIGNGETLIYFDESDLDKTVDIFHIRTSGVNIAPYSIRNLHLFKWYKDNKEYSMKAGETYMYVCRIHWDSGTKKYLYRNGIFCVLHTAYVFLTHFSILFN